MSVTLNAKGTSTSSFKVGKDGTIITQGGVISPPAASDLIIDIDQDQSMVIGVGNSGPALITSTADQDLHINPAAGGGQYLILNSSRWPTTTGTTGQALTTNGAGILSWTTIAGSGTVSSVAISTANGIEVSGSPITTSGTFSLSLNAITPTSVSASGTVTGSNLSGTHTGTSSGTNTGDQTISLTGDVTGSGTGSFSATLASVGTVVSDSFVKITTDSKGRVSATSAVASSDITSVLTYTPVNKAGDTMTGALILNANPSAALGAATKQYVDSELAAVASGINVHPASETATTAALAASTYNNGTGGVGATLTANTNISLGTIGGYAGLNTSSRLLVKNQASAIQNGIYTVTSLGVDGVLPWILTRATDFDGSPTSEVVAGDMTFIQEGTLAGTQWVQSTVGTGSPGDYVIIGTDSMVFSQFAGPGTYTAGTGIDIATTVISNTGVTSAVAGTNIAVSGATGAVTFSVTGTVPTATSATTATALASGRTFSLSTDATGTSGSFDGSGDVTIPMTLATVNSSPQTDTFRKITVNSKGLVTGTSSVSSSDVTTSLGYTPVNKAGDTMTGTLTAQNGKIILGNYNVTGAWLEMMPPDAGSIFYQQVRAGSVLGWSHGSAGAAALMMSLDNGGKVAINANAGNLRLNQKFVVGNGGGNTYGGMGIHNFSSTITTAGVFDFLRSASNTDGTGAALASGSDLGYLAWRGFTDTSAANVKDGAYLLATTTEAWTTSSSPADLKIFTTISGATNPLERVRITSDGALLVGTSSTTIGNDTSSWFGAGGSTLSNQTVIHLPNNATATWIALGIYRGSSQIGSIQYNGSGTSFVTTSDERLKENIVNASSAGAKIDAMQVREFDFKSGGHIEHGFIAQELNEVAPEAVNVGGDDVNLQPWGVDYSKLVPMLVKEIQELRARVQDLSARVVLLELNG